MRTRRVKQLGLYALTKQQKGETVMAKIWTSACIMCIVVTMTIGSASARIRAGSQVRQPVGTGIKVSTLESLLEKQVLLEGKSNLGRIVLRLGRNLQKHQPIYLDSTAGLWKLNLNRWNVQARLDVLLLSESEYIQVIELPKLRSSINQIGARLVPGSSVALYDIHDGVLGRL
jgi:hypothetical protein